MSQLRSKVHQQSSILEFEHFGLHRATLFVVDAVLTARPTEAAVVGIDARADEMIDGANIFGRGNWHDDPTRRQNRDSIIVENVIARRLGNENGFSKRRSFIGGNSQEDLQVGERILDEV